MLICFAISRFNVSFYMIHQFGCFDLSLIRRAFMNNWWTILASWFRKISYEIWSLFQFLAWRLTPLFQLWRFLVLRFFCLKNMRIDNRCLFSTYLLLVFPAASFTSCSLKQAIIFLCCLNSTRIWLNDICI
jgi:hypothetical protein